MTFQQVTFHFDAGRVVGSDWGQFQVDPRRLALFTEECGGYINVFTYSDSRRDPDWVVENMRVDPPENKACIDPEKRDVELGIFMDPFSRNSSAAILTKEPPMSTYFDLRPEEVGTGMADKVLATVLFSRQPLPFVSDLLRMVKKFRPHSFKVEQVIDNAEGDLSGQDSVRSTASPVFEGPIALVGQPPQASSPPAGPPSDLLFPIEIIQSKFPNINAANNQCVPMAHANALMYLEYRYNHLPLKWDVPHFAIRGIGRVLTSGDIVFWEPIPPNSVIARVDTLTMRSGVFNLDTGGGSDRCQNIRGVMGYLGNFGNMANVKFRHQDDIAVYGDGGSCDSDSFLFMLDGISSQKEGDKPTWEWMFDQLQKGRSVVMSFGRYDSAGTWKSGHMVRVYGALKLNNKKYLHTLDDGDQGNNYDGLRTQTW